MNLSKLSCFKSLIEAILIAPPERKTQIEKQANEIDIEDLIQEEERKNVIDYILKR